MRAAVLAEGERITLADLDLPKAQAPAPAPIEALPSDRAEHAEEEAARLLRALNERAWNVSRTSRELGIPRQNLYRKMKRYGVHRAARRRR